MIAFIVPLNDLYTNPFSKGMQKGINIKESEISRQVGRK